VRELVARYANTTLGRQELDGEMFDEAPGALWKRANIEAARRTDVISEGLRARWGLGQEDERLRQDTATAVLEAIQLPRIVVAIDPATTSEEGSDETGIVVCGMDRERHFWVLEDVSGVYSPNQWATVAMAAYRRWSADKIVAEDNQGGEMVESQLRQVAASAPIARVHASKGKEVRAGPAAGAYEQGRGHHIRRFSDLEDQLCGWEPGSGDSPDRLDALVWGFTELLGDGADDVLDLGLGGLHRK
jgi:phage terminase large subunit-like protein